MITKEGRRGTRNTSEMVNMALTSMAVAMMMVIVMVMLMVMMMVMMMVVCDVCCWLNSVFDSSSSDLMFTWGIVTVYMLGTKVTNTSRIVLYYIVFVCLGLLALSLLCPLPGVGGVLFEGELLSDYVAELLHRPDGLPSGLLPCGRLVLHHGDPAVLVDRVLEELLLLPG